MNNTESIKALNALRDEAQRSTLSSLMEAQDLVTLCNRAIASLESAPAAEQPKPSTFCKCEPAREQYDVDCPVHSAHQPPAEQAQQPAPAKERIWFCKIGGIVDPMPHGADGPMREAVAEAFKRLNGHAEPAFIFSGWGGELTEPERAVVENRLPREQPAPADVPPMPEVLAYLHELDNTDGIEGNEPSWAFSEDADALPFGVPGKDHSEEYAVTVIPLCDADDVRALHAACISIARERDEARRELEAVKEDKRCALDLLAQERARADKAEAELAAAMRGQEPVGWWWIEDGVMHEPSRTRFTTNRAGVPWNGQPLYAAPVPAPDSIPLAQHEAEMERMQVETQRQERAGCSRSHPHEYMTPMCELRTRIARLENAAVQHEAALAQARRDERERIAEEAITQSSLRLGSKRLPSIVMAETDADVVRADTEGRILAWFAAAIRALPDNKEEGK